MMTSEEVHIVGLFEGVEAAISMQELAYATLQPGENDEKVFGVQVVANEFDEVEAVNNRLLIGATTLRLHEVVAAIHERQGLAVAAHIDRMSFSILGQLGFIPEDLKLDALEISQHMAMAEAGEQFREYKNIPFISASDAHSLEEIGRRPIRLKIARPDVAELKLALAGRGGRKVCGSD
jgi:PHP family Zn ribbon phosphoesterase